MEIQSSTQTSQTVNTSNAENSSSLSAASDFDTFLQLLTAQLENQDPLNPLESTDFVAQLASFSAVEQQILTNSNLSDIMSSLSVTRTSEAAQWLGKEVLAPASARYEGAPIEVVVSPDADASHSHLEVSDISGNVLASLPIPPGTTTFNWDGQVNGGGDASFGDYNFTVIDFDGEKQIGSTPGMVFSTITEILLDQGETYLVFGDGSQTKLNETSRLRS